MNASPTTAATQTNAADHINADSVTTTASGDTMP